MERPSELLELLYNDYLRRIDEPVGLSGVTRLEDEHERKIMMSRYQRGLVSPFILTVSALESDPPELNCSRRPSRLTAFGALRANQALQVIGGASLVCGIDSQFLGEETDGWKRGASVRYHTDEQLCFVWRPLHLRFLQAQA